VSKGAQESDIDYYLHKAAVERAKPRRRRPVITSTGTKRTTVDVNDEDAKSGKRRRIRSGCTANDVDPWIMDSKPEENFEQRVDQLVKQGRLNIHQGSTESHGETIEKVSALPEQSKHEATKVRALTN